MTGGEHVGAAVPINWALFGTRALGAAGVEGPIVLPAEDNMYGCAEHSVDMTGGVAVLVRGGCGFGAKVINAEHSRAYGKAMRAARSMGDNEARHFSIFGFTMS